MGRIHIGGTTYESVLSGSYSEADFENVIFSQREFLFPNHHLVRFKSDVRWNRDIRRADFALVDRKYRSWWVVEVELNHHSLNNHVIPQVEVLRNGEYAEHHAESIAMEDSSLDSNRLLDLVVRSNPQVWVIVDKPAPTWVEPLKALRVPLGIIEMFTSDKATYALRVNGAKPAEVTSGFGLLSNVLGRVWRVEGMNDLGTKVDQEIGIDFNGDSRKWVIKRLAGDITIVSSGDSLILDPKRRYFLIQHEDDSFSVSEEKPYERLKFDEI